MTQTVSKINRKKILIFFLLVIFLVSIDLLIKDRVEKNWVRENDNSSLAENERLIIFSQDINRSQLIIKEIVVIKNFWSFIYIRNYNIGFSILSFLENYFAPKTLNLFFKLLQLFGVILILFFFFLRKMEHLIPFGLIVAGGLGNVIDRFARGYVVDYVKWFIPSSPIKLFNPWPIFNLADVYITCGFIALLIYIFLKKENTND